MIFDWRGYPRARCGQLQFPWRMFEPKRDWDLCDQIVVVNATDVFMYTVRKQFHESFAADTWGSESDAIYIQ